MTNSGAKYLKSIKGVQCDVYDVLVAFGVTCPARQHAIKKLLVAGCRGAKDTEQDLRESIDAIERAIELVQGIEGLRRTVPKVFRD